MNKKRNNTYDRVMPRVYDRSRSSLTSVSKVTRHEKPSSARVGAKEITSNVSSGVFRELPTVLNDYVPESSRETVKKSNVVKPRRTVKSQDPAKSPPKALVSTRQVYERPRNFRTGGSSASVSHHVNDKWSNNHVRQCYSSRSHTKLKELKEEIKAYEATDKLMKLRSQLYKNCGVVFDDGVEDKGVQAEEKEAEPEVIRRRKWLTILDREDLLEKEVLKKSSHLVCSAHFEESSIKTIVVKHVKKNALPLKLPQEDSSDSERQSTSTGVKNKVTKSNKIIKEGSSSSEVPSSPKEYVTVGTQTESLQSTEKQTQTSKLLTEKTPRKRKLPNELRDSKLKRSKK